MRVVAMLRITVHDKPRALTFQLEGRLAGPWVRVLEDSWPTTEAGQRKAVLRVDLTEVTSIDAAGKALLAAMHRRGAEFVAADCLTKAVVVEIISQSSTSHAAVGGITTTCETGDMS
jgi:ABC-type transporter Mla MlaB component